MHAEKVRAEDERNRREAACQSSCASAVALSGSGTACGVNLTSASIMRITVPYAGCVTLWYGESRTMASATCMLASSATRPHTVCAVPQLLWSTRLM